ncbi:sugar phosphate isomerase/epimerase [Methanoplanus sp. FWC-SCC4]|uniref:Sugar phosphate isomerase/epimerase n=1 Tax=Methanochimaera problematica TaxID=2609417 RepID=A0AA97I429_9EURY|nr:sugar phosphate isomerase/epimerase family protein [Methanoplanus sp. FWC-SCC4]WOF16079.1 sugar phosphate isomerase/epimerase [Methanoplanus sp. FWC-SCC4]
MSCDYYFASSAKVWSSIEWVYGIEETGYDGWEISADGNYRLDNKEANSRIKEVLETTTLKASVHAPFADLNLASMNHPIYNETIRQMNECIKLASDFTDRVTIHPGYLSPAGKLVPDKVWGLQKDALTEIGKVALEYGVRVGLENMPDIPDFLCRDCNEIFGMIDSVDGMGITIDLGHANTVGQLDKFLSRLCDAGHLHIHDNMGKRDDHSPLGEGNIDWDKAGALIKKNYSGICVVEGRSIEESKKSLGVIKRCFL